MTSKEDLHGSLCSTLASDRRAQIEQDYEQNKKHRPTFCGRLTLCGQSLWDCDNYLAKAVGTLYKTVRDPLTGRVGTEVRLDWCDHGHTTHYFLEGYHVGNRPSAQVSPRVYLESIWSAGKVLAYRLMTERREQESGS